MEESDEGIFVTKQDFKEICRCCLTTVTLGSIFELKYEDTPLVDIFHSLFSTQLHPDDDLPKKICETCTSEVIRYYDFKRRYEASEAALQNVIAMKAEDVCVEIKSELLVDNVEEIAVPHADVVKSEKVNNTEGNIKRKVKTKKQFSPIKKQSTIFTCSCKETFTSTWEIREHRELTNHHVPGILPCEICGKLIPKRSLRSHSKTHEAVKPYGCDRCEARFASSGNLQRHMMVHTGEKPYICDICGRQFTQLKTLKLHRAIHTGDKPLLCAFCGKRFRHKTSYDFHVQNHKKKMLGSSVETRPFACEICNKRFVEQQSFRKHCAVHTEEKQHTCPLCPNKFRRTTHLRNHMMVHTGERPHVCEFCNKRFSHKYNLNIHVRIHTGEKPFTCDKCAKMFHDPRSLRKHKQTKH